MSTELLARPHRLGAAARVGVSSGGCYEYEREDRGFRGEDDGGGDRGRPGCRGERGEDDEERRDQGEQHGGGVVADEVADALSGRAGIDVFVAGEAPAESSERPADKAGECAQACQPESGSTLS